MRAYEEGSCSSSGSPDPERGCPGLSRLSDLSRMKNLSMKFSCPVRAWNARRRTPEKWAKGGVRKYETRDVVAGWVVGVVNMMGSG
jgi:hypothetical protein